MSSIRLYVLAALADEGEMHGHQLRQLAEREHVHLWTDVTVGALYGALKRMAAEGLIAEVRTEQMGGYPERQVWGLTDAGLDALDDLRRRGVEEIQVRPDPLDLALSRSGSDRSSVLPTLLEQRLAGLRAIAADTANHHADIQQYLTPLERVVATHRTARLAADIRWHEQLLDQLPELLAAEDSAKEPRR